MSRGTRTPVLGCIADDFTGATDLANNLVRSGMRTVQTIGVPLEWGAAVDAEAIVVALKSRTIAPARAVEQSVDALRWLRAQGVQQVYFKYCSTFESTPQGNIGPVTDALLDALADLPDSDFTIACPAFPQNQRSVFKGHLFVGEQLLSDSGMRDHPLTPMTDANLVRVLQRQTRRPVGLVPYEVVSQGPAAIRDRIAALHAAGIRIAIVDAVSDADLKSLGAASRGKALVTGGSGLALGLAQNWPSIAAQGDDAARLPPAAGRRAVISGSCSLATNAQVLYFQRLGRPSFAIDPLAVAAGEDVVGQALEWAERHRSEPVWLFYATADAAAVKAVQARLGTSRAGEVVERALSTLALALVERGVRQLVVAGGETSGAVVGALRVRQMSIGSQIDPGVPWTAAHSPVGGGVTLHVALKSGNFGADDFFTRAFDALVLA